VFDWKFRPQFAVGPKLYTHKANGVSDPVAYYQCVLSFEAKLWEDEAPDLAVAGAKRVPNRAWALLDE
jgi:hypothetical protein